MCDDKQLNTKIKHFCGFRNTLVLYYHPFNYYSQKVLLILHEKNVAFTPYIVELSSGEQYSEWFLNINPQGEVPVLQDGSFIIPGSGHIINYIEHKFKGEKFSPLTSQNRTIKEATKIAFFEQIFKQLPIVALSLGSFIHGDDLSLTPKPPFIGPARKTFLSNNEKVFELLKKSISAKSESKAASSLLHKIELYERRKKLIYSRNEFQKMLDAVENVLRFVENDIKENPARKWLITSDFLLPDISFGLLLLRLYQMGYEKYYWTNGKLPHVESFFLRFRKRSCCQKLMPSNIHIMQMIWQKTPVRYKISAGAGILGMIMIVAVLAHRKSLMFIEEKYNLP